MVYNLKALLFVPLLHFFSGALLQMDETRGEGEHDPKAHNIRTQHHWAQQA